MVIVFLVVLVVALTQSGCVSLAGNLTASQSNLSFGNVAIGSSRYQSVTFANSGTAAFTITRAAASGSGFTVTGPALPLTLAEGQSATFMARFAPSSIGSASGSLMITKTQETTPQLTGGGGSATPSISTDQKTIAMAGTGVSGAPTITTQPASQTVTAGQSATFSATSSGAAPLSYQWSKNGMAISGATSTTYTTPATATSDSGSLFTVVVSNSAGNVTSNAATLTVTAAAVAPSITTQPANQTVTVGQKATFSVTASGTAPVGYQWRKNGAAISGATSASYTTPVTTISDSGSPFTVLVSDSTGSVTSNAAILTVNTAAAAPAIITQPASQTIVSGQTATFSVTASGTAPLSYQWRKNGTAISGATSSAYTTPVTTTSDSGSQFAVAVSNSTGAVTSSTATLTVKAAGQLTASTTNLSYGNVSVGSNSMLPVTLANSGGSSVSISNVTLSGAGLSANGVSSGMTLAAGSSVTLNVTFAPSASGILNGSVNVTSNATNPTLTIFLSGTAVQRVSHSVTLNLAPNSSSVAGYNVYRSSISNGPYTKLNSLLVASTTYTDTTVLANQTYFYVGTSVDSAGDETPYSNQVSATIPTP